MPLKKGKSKKVINSNIEELLHSYNRSTVLAILQKLDVLTTVINYCNIFR